MSITVAFSSYVMKYGFLLKWESDEVVTLHLGVMMYKTYMLQLNPLSVNVGLVQVTEYKVNVYLIWLQSISFCSLEYFPSGANVTPTVRYILMSCTLTKHVQTWNCNTVAIYHFSQNFFLCPKQNKTKNKTTTFIQCLLSEEQMSTASV